MNFFNKIWEKRVSSTGKSNIKASGYGNHGASKMKKSLISWQTESLSVDENIHKNSKILIERSRDLAQGSSIANGAIKTIKDNVIGSGLTLTSTIDHKLANISSEKSRELEDLIEKNFHLWSYKKIDNLGLMNFYQVQDLAFHTTLVTGECFIKLNYFESFRNPFLLKLQLIEPERVHTPKDKEDSEHVKNGIEFDKNGRVASYYISDKFPNSSDFGESKYEKIDVFGENGQLNIIHLMIPERPEQVRGIPLLAPVIESLKQLERYTEAELTAAVVSGMYAIFIKTQGEDPASFGESVVSENNTVDKDDRSFALRPGMMAELDPGEDIVVSNPGRPNPAFDPFIMSILRQVGTSLGVPFELLIKHFTSSYSASRAALLEAWKVFKKRRAWFANNFCQSVYEEWLRECYLSGRIDLKGFDDDELVRYAYSRSEWVGPSQGQIDPLKEIVAAEKRITLGVSTRTRETSELTGGSFERNLELLAKEEKIMKEKGVMQDE